MKRNIIIRLLVTVRRPQYLGRWIRQRSPTLIRSLTCYTQEVPQMEEKEKILPYQPGGLQDHSVKRWPVFDPDPPATSVHHPQGCYASAFMSSPGLHVPIISQPYGLQLWLLADVCPSHFSIIGPLGSRRHLLGLLRILVSFWLSALIIELVFPPKVGVFFPNKTCACSIWILSCFPAIKWSALYVKCKTMKPF